MWTQGTISPSSFHLEHCQHSDGEGVEVGGRCAVREVERPSEQLHPEEGEDQDEQEEKQQQGDDGLHRAQQGYHQVPQ